MQVAINKQTQIEEALDLEGHGIRQNNEEGYIYSPAQQILYDLFAYSIISKGTGIQLVVEESPNQITFLFQECQKPCVTPEGFINQILSSRWTVLMKRYQDFTRYLLVGDDDILGITINYRNTEKGRVLTRAMLIKQVRNSP